MVCYKSCPRCSGNQVLESEWYGRYVFCLSCGHMTFPDGDVAQTAETGLRPASSIDSRGT